MRAEIISVGTELLLGDILNTNTRFISKKLAEYGIPLYFQTVVGDNMERLLQAIETAFSRCDLVITTGGLGPTGDDITKEGAAGYFNKKLVLDEEIYNELKTYIESQGYPFSENNKKQALTPEGAEVLENHNGTAPGYIISEKGKTIILLPGPPSEMVGMFENSVEPYLRRLTGKTYYSRVLRICGIGESMVETLIKDLMEKQTNPTIAPYAKEGEVHVRITASADDEESAKALTEPTAALVYDILGKSIYAEGETTLEELIINRLAENNLDIAIAESLTGGILTGRLISCPGASKVVKEGIVSYSNESKCARLGVKEETLSAYGAVSKEIAEEMAQGVSGMLNTAIGVSTTGIAGPDGGSSQKPVGLVYVSVYFKGKLCTKEFRFNGSRERIRNRTAVNALNMLRGIIEDGI